MSKFDQYSKGTVPIITLQRLQDPTRSSVATPCTGPSSIRKVDPRMSFNPMILARATHGGADQAIFLQLNDARPFKIVQDTDHVVLRISAYNMICRAYKCLCHVPMVLMT